MTDRLLEIDRLAVDYPGSGRSKPVRALEDISLRIRPGETVGLVGESGSGKTTLGRAILGLIPVAEGNILFDGNDISHLRRRERRALSADIQVVFQDPYTSLNPSMTVEDILSEPLIVAGRSRRDAVARTRELLDRVHLPHDAGRRLPREFSGGQRQRIAIARAMALSPRLIVCDEPVSALDLTTQARVLALFTEIQESTGVSYLFITHDLSVVRAVSHSVLVLYRGKIVESGRTAVVTSAPTHPYTRRLFMSAPVADPERQKERRLQRLALTASEGTAA
ncbi:ABC transporter ATP-binding protein [Pseudoclavibacter endophyticus]|uniref:ABC transporter ATP-binding protein n=1 Tax=Pseudoclavibacter endophyticus TaxID=1778590 RepID=A0A6H9WQE8_9MICO|nr:ABC transporter ATP-binding protein [Pseudoclavibacter endophyticus]KAB1650368.1 ABC transporter ATP-binding protein [Pseudoclavibacter endophyticus]GGA54756.1 ABC transporter ATP-binding protein [Pseudoclavibacter endophyticus]